MSFLKDFKDELSQAVNELVNIDEAAEEKKDSEKPVLDSPKGGSDTEKNDSDAEKGVQEMEKNSSAGKKENSKKKRAKKYSSKKTYAKDAQGSKMEDDNVDKQMEETVAAGEDNVMEADKGAREDINNDSDINKDENIEADIDMQILNELFGEKQAEKQDGYEKTEYNSSEEDFSIDNIDISDYLEEDKTDESEADIIEDEKGLTEEDSEYSIEKEDEEVSEEFSIKDIADDIKETLNDEKLEEMLNDNKEKTKAALRGERYEESGNRGSINNDAYADRVDEESSLAAEEVAEITKGTMIEGNMVSDGSVNVNGKIKGNVACRGKLFVSGTIVGASRAADVVTNNAKINGDVTSDGGLKIGNGTVIIGNVYGSSAVIAGAVQGDIDIHGPVIIDATAVIQGNIRSRSVQINNGAAIEGMVSQCYAEIDYAALFDKTFCS